MADMSQAEARGWGGKAIAAMTRLPDRILTAVEGWWERDQLRRELHELSQRGALEGVLADCGIAPSDVPRLLRSHPHTRQQLAMMMSRLGIDRTALPCSTMLAEALRAIEWRCGECSEWRACRAWLASPDASEDYRAFCPNADAFDRLPRADAARSQASGERGTGATA